MTLHPPRVTVDNIRVLHDYLVIKPLAVPARKAGGLIEMPGTATERERNHHGVVLAVGPGDFNEPGTARVPMSLGVGDLVFFGKYSGTEEELGDRTVLVMRESECRISVPAGSFTVVEHADAKLDHLAESWCEVCDGIPLEQAAKERLELEREALVVKP
jgi:chaperonin GroES